MKKVLILLLVIALMLPLIAADKPPKAPKIIRLALVNRSGEDVRVTLTGLGYDFKTNEFIGGWGALQPQFYSVLVPGTMTVNNVVIRLPQNIKNMDVLRDLYILNLQYNRELVPEGSNAAAVICLNTWLPVSMYGDPTYFPVRYTNSRLIIKPCNQVPVNIGSPSEGIVKYNRYNLILEFPGYYGYSWK